MPYRCRPLLAGLMAVTAACDLPTEPPKWETMWIAPLTRTEVPIASFLPPLVSVTEDGSEFRVAVGGAEFSGTLGELCPACGPVHGVSVPKPAFAHTIEDAVALPADVLSARIAAGRIVIELTNGFGFDPVRPSATARGRIVSVVTSAGAVVATDTLDGADEAFPPGVTERREIVLEDAAVAGEILVSVVIESPAGDAVSIDTSRVFGVAVLPFDLGATEATVRFTEEEVAIRPVELDLAGVNPNFTERARRGAFLLEITNPFSAGGTFALEVATPQTRTVKPFTLAPGEATRRIDFTGPELRMILGRDGVVLSATGVLTSTAGSLTLRPAQAVVIRSRIELVLGPEGG